MNWNALPALICVICLLSPVAVILCNRFYTHRSLTALLVYYIMTAAYILMAVRIIPVSFAFRNNFGILDNYLDAPLMLFTLLFFCPNKQKQKIVNTLSLSFIAYEIIVTCIHGFKPISVVYIVGPGLIVILSYSLYLFVRQTKFSILHNKNYGRVIMLASIFFAYSSYLLIYYFYYIERVPEKEDTQLLYYISSSVSAIAMTIGLQLMRRRMKELKSLKTTRKELALFFSHSS